MQILYSEGPTLRQRAGISPSWLAGVVMRSRGKSDCFVTLATASVAKACEKGGAVKGNGAPGKEGGRLILQA